MSSQQLESLIHRYPQERESITRLFDLIEAEKKLITRHRVFTINRLIDKIMPRSILALSEILSVLEQQGILKKILRVESPTTKAGIKDFSSYMDIPNIIHDPYSDTELNIKSDDVKLLYSVKDNNHLS
ncbi:MAG: hypothetical protein JAZ19_03850 [Candidatus Thiodiazotropha taylori]|nr:hypothetical protein [Candidatus Thiodiazotropha taylori]